MPIFLQLRYGDVQSLQSQTETSFFSAGETILEIPSGIYPIVSLASLTSLIAALLCLFVSSSTHFNF